jgi:hypothetical protein
VYSEEKATVYRSAAVSSLAYKLIYTSTELSMITDKEEKKRKNNKHTFPVPWWKKPRFLLGRRRKI